jgi:uncharacterized SAM-binding protein YcdF (DUF218 family)
VPFLEGYEQNIAIAIQLGVPSDAVSVVSARPSSTVAEAAAIVAELGAQRIDSILLVTSQAHSRRSALNAHRLAPASASRATIAPMTATPLPQ